jgi:hypothetical protein
MFPMLAAAGRSLMGVFKGGNPAKMLTGGAPGGPRGLNEVKEGGAKAAGKSSPLDIMGNVANIGGTAMMGVDMFKGGHSSEKPKSPSTYESVLD